MGHRFFSRNLKFPGPFRRHARHDTNTVGYAALTPDGKRIISGSTDAAIRIWNTATGEEMAMLVGFEDGEWLVITSEGYYSSSEKGAQYLNVKYEERTIPLTSSTMCFYRPDIVAAKLQGQDIKDLITITMKDAIKAPPPSLEFYIKHYRYGQSKGQCLLSSQKYGRRNRRGAGVPQMASSSSLMGISRCGKNGNEHRDCFEQ